MLSKTIGRVPSHEKEQRVYMVDDATTRAAQPMAPWPSMGMRRPAERHENAVGIGFQDCKDVFSRVHSMYPGIQFPGYDQYNQV